MKKIVQQFRHLTLTAGLALFTAVPAMADDTEVYLGASTTPSDVRPNLVFIIDTSGSMSTNVTSTTTNGTYDPATSYSGSCDAGKVYWSDNTTIPKCSTTSQYVDASSNTCNDSATALGTTGSGFYVGRFAQYYKKSNKYQWNKLSSSKHSDKIECQTDWGVHGESSATNPYPANASNGGPWRANNTGNKAINWNSVGASYTLYSGNYLNWRESATTTVTKTRLKIVQEVFGNLMDSISNINVAVMRFDADSGSSNNGGYFIAPMQQLDNSTRTTYKDAVNALTANGNTPLAETLYESYLFYRGDNVKFGNSTNPGHNVAGVLDGASKYKSPIEYQCQKNFVILLTDGDPTSDGDADTAINGLPGFSTTTGGSCSFGSGNDCLDELADYMYAKDCSNLHDDKQNVITYTIGFTTNQTLLSQAASKGGGKYYTADDTTGLTDAFTQILTDILAINTTFIAPAVSVNAFNRFTHRDELYYAVFRPSATPDWDGNVKRYRLYGNPPEIVDANGALAIDGNTGFFKTTSQSWWSTAADGDVVKEGGAAGALTLPRTIYTYTGSTAPSNESLTAASNKLHESNAAITKDMLGDASMSDADRTSLLQWARGVDVLDDDSDGAVDDIRHSMGDPLHAKPVLVTYGGDDANPDITLYAGTNEGYLHAINPANGTEIFTFAPQALLPNLKKLYDDAASVAHPYGLDGPLTLWFNDLNDNGILYTSGSLEAGEFVYLYQGMRRGGSNYYALDVTDRAAPKLKWVINGGSSGTSGFSELGQTWSAASKAKIKVGGADTTVLVFGGGYDEGQDSNATAQDDAIGRAVFMVNATTGAKVWQAGPSGSNDGADPDLVLTEMKNSIPADVRVFDSDGDGYTDRMYTADMGGRIWRFDINNSGSSSTVTGGVIAKLGDNTPEGNRRFYYSPEVALSKDKRFLNIAVGSGYRAHPLNTAVHDAMFVIHDFDVYGPSTDGSGNVVYTTLTINDLYDTTSNLIGEGTSTEIDDEKVKLSNKKGWYIWLNKSDGSFNGEKVLSKALITHDMLLYTTFTPVASSSNACSPSQGSARLYQVFVKDGTPVSDFDSSGGDLTRSDREFSLVRGGIPPEPSLIFHENGPVVIVGTEKIPDPGYSLTPTKTYWQIQ